MTSTFGGIDVNSVDQSLAFNGSDSIIEVAEEVIVYPKLKAKITEISTFGDLTIKFSEKTNLDMD